MVNPVPAQLRIDDITVVLDAPFNGTAIRRLGLYVLEAGVAWFDEVRLLFVCTAVRGCVVCTASFRAVLLAVTAAATCGTFPQQPHAHVLLVTLSAQCGLWGRGARVRCCRFTWELTR